MKPKTLTLDGKTSRSFDMRCYRAMSAAGKTGDAMDMALVGIAELFDIDITDLLHVKPKILIPLIDTVNRWFREAASAIKPATGGSTMLEGDPIMAMYADLLRHSGILPDEIDRQDPALFYAVVTERHITEKDIPPDLRALNGL